MAPLRIDTHQHIVPPRYAQWLASRGIDAGGRAIPEWTPEGALDLMEAAGVQSAILSVSTPGTHLGDDQEARDWTQEVNEFSADVAKRFPGKFGFFATLCLPDVQGSIEAARYALDELKADGVVLLANVNGVYLGDPSVEPLLAELNRLKAKVFIHPSHIPAPSLPGIPAFAADFLLDTTRAALNIAQSGALERYPDLKFILSHAGGFVPFAAERMARTCSPDGSNEAGLARLRKFYFDTALSSSPYALPSLLAFADPTHITFGSDWPFAPKERSLHFTQLLEAYPLDEAQRHAINRGNAAALFPRFA